MFNSFSFKRFFSRNKVSFSFIPFAFDFLSNKKFLQKNGCQSKVAALKMNGFGYSSNLILMLIKSLVALKQNEFVKIPRESLFKYDKIIFQLLVT